MYEVFIRDSQFRRIGQVNDFTNLELIPRFNAVGSFVFDIPTDTLAAKELIKPKYGIIVKRDGQTLFSGNVTGRKRSFSGSSDTMTLVGKDDMQCLANRIVYPEPSGNFFLSAYDVRTGTAETIMKQYVDYNAGPNALSHRRLVSLEVDKGLGSIVSGRGRFHNLLEFLSSLALKGGGLGFNVVQVDNTLQFQVYQPTDKTRRAFFSPLLGNLSSFEYSQDNPEANAVIVGGGGEGQERILKGKQNTASVAKHGRIETFVDQRDTTNETELNESLAEELISKAEQSSFSFTPIDTPQLAFGRDYGLGDKVSVVITLPGENAYSIQQQEKLDVIQDIVREVKITIDRNGESIFPVVGTEESNKNSILGIFDKIRKFEKRISNLERM